MPQGFKSINFFLKVTHPISAINQHAFTCIKIIPHPKYHNYINEALFSQTENFHSISEHTSPIESSAGKHTSHLFAGIDGLPR